MIEVFVSGAAIRAPGLEGWEASRPILAGGAPAAAETPRLPPPAILPPNERRRAGPVTRLALLIAQEAAAMAGLPPATLRTVFASSNGDGTVIHAILETLSGPDRQVSPTQFHNSVHNAPAGYWSIGAGSRQAACCLGCHDAAAAAGLLAAAAEAAEERCPVLLCLYDVPMPAPLGDARPTGAVFGAALVLAPERAANSLARLCIGYRGEPAPPEAALPRHPSLRELARSNPAARILRLLEALARGEGDECALPLLDGRVEISVSPCSTAPASSR